MDTINQYYRLKVIADSAYMKFDNNPTQANSDMYGIALNNLRDFCMEVVEQLIANSPELIAEVRVNGSY